MICYWFVLASYKLCNMWSYKCSQVKNEIIIEEKYSFQWSTILRRIKFILFIQRKYIIFFSLSIYLKKKKKKKSILFYHGSDVTRAMVMAPPFKVVSNHLTEHTKTHISGMHGAEFLKAGNKGTHVPAKFSLVRSKCLWMKTNLKNMKF